MAVLLASLLLLPLVRAAEFDFRQHLGNLSPYFAPHPVNGLSGSLGAGMPNCALEQVQLLHRHGSRLPGRGDGGLITNLSMQINDPTVSAQLDALTLPDEWKFIQGPQRWKSNLGQGSLTPPGRMQGFDHGVQFRLVYPAMPFEKVLAGNLDRVIETAEWFRDGLFGVNKSLASTLSLINEDNVTRSSITPTDSCAKWFVPFRKAQSPDSPWANTYLPIIQKRINTILSPVKLSIAHVHGAFYACAYELAAYDEARWCKVFQESEILNFEYELDLITRNSFGYGLPNRMGQVLGSLYASDLIERFTSPSASKTYLEFGHDASIDLALTAIGVAADQEYNPTHPNPARAWRSSQQASFGAMMVWEKWSCPSTAAASGTQVRLLLNGAPISLAPVCGGAATDAKTGACALTAFVNATAEVRKVTWRDATWNATCNL